MVRQFLCGGRISDGGEGVVQQGVGYVAAVQLARQPVVAIAVKLQPEGTPGGYPEVTQAEILIDEIEVVVQALAIIESEKQGSRAEKIQTKPG